MDFISQFARSKDRTPEEFALVEFASETKYTYEELDRAASSVASGLQNRGIQHGDRVAICMANRAEHVITHLAVLKAGAVAVPFNFRLPADDIVYHIDDSDPTAFVFDSVSRDAVEGAYTRFDCKTCIYVGDDSPPDFADPFETLLSTDPEPAEVDINGDDLSSILYTSGTTGDPKGIPITHEAAATRAFSNALGQEYYHGETMLGIMPLYHTVGLHGILYSLLSLSGTYLCMPQFDPERAVEAIDEWNVTALHEAPTIFQGLLSTDNINEADVNCVSRVAFSGAPMSTSLFERVDEVFDPDRFTNIYGNTETYDPLQFVELRRHGDPMIVGWSNTFHRTRIVELNSRDPEATVEQGVEGELIVHTDSPASFSKYWNKPKETDKAIVDGWYFTGDAAYRTDNGNVVITGRADDLIISGGENIHPAEVEDAIASHIDVDDVGVVGESDDEWGEIVAAYVEGDATSEELDEWCLESESLADFKRPRKYMFVDSVPRNPSGKIMRYKLRGEDE